jgi:hypothetical protein
MERTIVVNDTPYRLESVTGRVLATTKSMKTNVSGSGGRLCAGTSPGSLRGRAQ